MSKLLVLALFLNFVDAFRLFNIFNIFQQRPPNSSQDGRIVGGTSADIKNYPYQLSLEYSGQHICGASILTTKYVVTAAHCTDGEDSNLLTIRSGTTYRGRGGITTDIRSIVQHPKFNRKTTDYDVAIIELFNTLTFDESTRPIVLTDAAVRDGTLATITGWGTTKENGRLPDQLQVVQVPIVNRLRCRIVYALFNPITDRMLCAGNRAGGKDSCQGDSGGPLVVAGKLTGIVSWGFGCARPYFPGVYTNIFNREIRDFIANVTRN